MFLGIPNFISFFLLPHDALMNFYEVFQVICSWENNLIKTLSVLFKVWEKCFWKKKEIWRKKTIAGYIFLRSEDSRYTPAFYLFCSAVLSCCLLLSARQTINTGIQFLLNGCPRLLSSSHKLASRALRFLSIASGVDLDCALNH